VGLVALAQRADLGAADLGAADLGPADLGPADLGPEAPSATALLPAFAKAAGLLVVLLGAALLLRHSGSGFLHTVRPGVGGAALLIVAGGAMVAGGLPRVMLALAGGYAFGAVAGSAIALIGQMLGCALDYAASHGLAAGLAQRVLARPSAARMKRLLVAHPFSTTLTLRLLPVGNNVVLNVLAGASRIRPGAFFAATLLGYIPQTIVFALLGSGTQVGKAAQLAIGVALFGCSAVLGVVLYRRSAEVT
jgi:uncharacterized membrane protein YdjX (TVP38/TMEM64 family)